MKKKTAKILISLLLIIAIPITVFAVQSVKEATTQSGNFTQSIVNRVNFSVENTDFVLKKSAQGTETFCITFTFTAQKTEADFYAVIDSFKISSISFDNIIFYADEANGNNVIPDGLVLNVENGKPIQYKWSAEMTLSVDQKGVYTPTVEIDYTAGLTKDTASSYHLSIPLTITVQ